MKMWIGVSLGIHVAVFGAVGTRPTPTRNLALPANVYSVSLVSMPAPRAAPRAAAKAAPKNAPVEKPVETVRTEPPPKVETKAVDVDKEAVKPPTPEPKKKEEPKVPKTEPVDQKKPQDAVPEKKPPESEVPQAQVSGESATKDAGDSDGASEGPAAVSALGQTNTQGSVSLDAANFGFSYYLVGLQAKVASNWFPPGSIGAPGEVLKATVHFRVMEDGAITDARVESSSGVSYFDRCALRAIVLSSPLAPLPTEFEEDDLGVHFEFTHTVSIH
uniref:Periplasmic protein TonB n=1 Tax=uncultured Latescibacterota bacterium TaxID=199737 RepID=Q2YZV9_9BACT|nr:periplasmic protein TonB [uncultured Latescibacterota bacterium]